MECLICGAWSETDENATDVICGACKRDGWTEDEHGQIYRDVAGEREIVAVRMKAGDDECPF